MTYLDHSLISHSRMISNPTIEFLTQPSTHGLSARPTRVTPPRPSKSKARAERGEAASRARQGRYQLAIARKL